CAPRAWRRFICRSRAVLPGNGRALDRRGLSATRAEQLRWAWDCSRVLARGWSARRTPFSRTAVPAVLQGLRHMGRSGCERRNLRRSACCEPRLDARRVTVRRPRGRPAGSRLHGDRKALVPDWLARRLEFHAGFSVRPAGFWKRVRLWIDRRETGWA